jgi:hypothetical protein
MEVSSWENHLYMGHLNHGYVQWPKGISPTWCHPGESFEVSGLCEITARLVMENYQEWGHSIVIWWLKPQLMVKDGPIRACLMAIMKYHGLIPYGNPHPLTIGSGCQSVESGACFRALLYQQPCFGTSMVCYLGDWCSNWTSFIPRLKTS